MRRRDRDGILLTPGRTFIMLPNSGKGRFAGRDPEPRPGLRSGHIPGSRSVPYNNLFDAATGKFFMRVAFRIDRPVERELDRDRLFRLSDDGRPLRRPDRRVPHRTGSRHGERTPEAGPTRLGRPHGAWVQREGCGRIFGGSKGDHR